MTLIDAQQNADQVLYAERSAPTVNYISPTPFPNQIAFTSSPLGQRGKHPRPVSENPGFFQLESRNYDLLESFFEEIEPLERQLFLDHLQRRLLDPACFVDVGKEVLGKGQTSRTSSNLPLIAEFLVRHGGTSNFLRALGRIPLRPGLTRLLLHLEEMIALDYRLFSNEDYDELWHIMVKINSGLKELASRQYATAWNGLRTSDATESNYRFHVCEEGPILCDSIAAQSKQAKYLRLVAAAPLKSTKRSKDRQPPMHPASEVVAKEIDSLEPSGDGLSHDNVPSQVGSSLGSIEQEAEIEFETMSEIKDCLPQHAVQHFVALSGIRIDFEAKSYQQKLTQSRAQAAAVGQLRSGSQELWEWELKQNQSNAIATGLVEDFIATCKLYEIPITQPLCNRLLQAIQEMLHAHYRNALNAHAQSVPSAPKIPLSVRTQMSVPRFPVLNSIRVMVEKARIEDEKSRLAMTKEKINVGSTYHQTIHQYGGVMNATQSGDVNVQHLTTEQLNTMQSDLAAVRAAFRNQGTLEADESVGIVAAAEKAAKEGDESKMLAFLKQIPAKAWDIGKDVISAALLAYLKAHGIVPWAS